MPAMRSLDLDGCRLSGEGSLALLLMRTGGNPLGSDNDVVVRCENSFINPKKAVGLRLAKISGSPVNPITLTPAVVDLSFASLHLQPIADLAPLYSEDLVQRGGDNYYLALEGQIMAGVCEVRLLELFLTGKASLCAGLSLPKDINKINPTILAGPKSEYVLDLSRVGFAGQLPESVRRVCNVWLSDSPSAAAVERLIPTSTPTPTPTIMQLSLMKELKALGLGRNNFSGQLPASLGKIGATLKALSFKGCHNFTGFVPNEILALTATIGFELALPANLELPDTLGHLATQNMCEPEMQQLHLYNSQLVGQIPDSISKVGACSRAGGRLLADSIPPFGIGNPRTTPHHTTPCLDTPHYTRHATPRHATPCPSSRSSRSSRWISPTTILSSNSPRPSSC